MPLPAQDKRMWFAGRHPAALAILLAALLCVGLGSASRGRTAVARDGPGVLTLTDGRSLEGYITERTDQVSIDVSGIVTTVPRSQVAGIEYGTPEERLRRRVEAAQTPDERMDVADEAIRRGLLDLAQEISQAEVEANAANTRAVRALDFIEQQRRLRRAGAPTTQTRPAGDDAPAARVLRPTRDNILNEEQINRIRQAELQERDVGARTRVNFQDGVLKRFTDSKANTDFRSFNALPDVSKALTILRETRDEEMREDIRIANHPVALLEYLRRVEPVVLNGCATSECHGGLAAGKFALYPVARDDAVSYTNFYLLSTANVNVPGARGAGRVFGEPQDEGGAAPLAKLIDRNRPDESLLLHYMLPRQQTSTPHPSVKGYEALVRNPSDPNYLIVRQWINDLLSPLPTRGYGFTFELTLPTATTQPAQSSQDQQQENAGN